MPERATDRPYDLVLFGATGFTGGLTAQYLAAHLPVDARWALAGRNQAKLEAVRERIISTDSPAPNPELLYADVSDTDSLNAFAASARVVASTVGPYLAYGEPLVAACARAGTDYLDLSGEPEFIDRMYLAHHATAVRSGARLVHACGFDSVPHDLGTLFTIKQLPSDVPLKIRGVVRSNAMFSGGTLHSALGQMARARQMRQAARDRRQAEPGPEGRRARANARSPHRDSDLRLWLLPLPTCDPMVVKRSAAARSDYGPDFTYSHYAGMRRVVTLIAAAAGAGCLAASAQIPPLRRLAGSRIPQGQGPTESRRARSWFTVDFIGETAEQKVHTQVCGGDPGYNETAKMLSEAAMCLAYDDNPATAGQVTTAAAMGETLLQRLIDAGITFSTIEPTSRPSMPNH
ncbi:saccharopine dehydrogenase NADP-binding domain-containing protein [Actinospica durhamensis]|uniref:Saccharopine dehydrogenase NADP-binding domain-containing protein n=1 Tax=Actinospica durhamensis TaxID=1508375 RepID=A0A941EXT4_9ACTN|nr:saccharopine dehydrogenase NADP-binding domain-containing protein [Actinospica durhamensis]